MKYHREKIIIGIISLIFILLISQPINLFTADLGRHIKNGELILSSESGVLSKNLYSYTFTDYSFLNHHWLSGVVFYLINQVFGFLGVHLFYVLLSLVTFLIFFHLALKYSNIYIASTFSLMTLPLITSREEVRPEVFSYLFIGIIFWLLYNFVNGKLSYKWLFVIVLIELLWVNLHIYFPFGLILVGIFTLDRLLLYLFKRDKNILKSIKILIGIGIISSLVLLLNPAGIKGILYPLKIFGNYGYRVFENQSIFFLEKITKFPDILYFKIILILLILSFIHPLYLSFKKRVPDLSPALLLIAALFGYLGVIAVRNFSIFSLFALAIISINFAPLYQRIKTQINPFIYISFLTVLVIILATINPSFWEGRQSGLGLMANSEKASQFFLENKLEGPIFNNYDIGGYLIYNLFPSQKVFVDNRPEAYPADFFEKTYIPMQEDESVWNEKLLKYKFNSIFFYRHDLTPWGQKFLITRIQDKEWAPIFVDDYSIIFLKRDEKNSELIKKFELPKEIFKISQ